MDGLLGVRLASRAVFEDCNERHHPRPPRCCPGEYLSSYDGFILPSLSYTATLTLALPSQGLMARSCGKSGFLRRESGLWDQLHRQRELVDRANGLLVEKSTEAEDLRLCCSNLMAEATVAWEQATPWRRR